MNGFSGGRTWGYPPDAVAHRAPETQEGPAPEEIHPGTAEAPGAEKER